MCTEYFNCNVHFFLLEICGHRQSVQGPVDRVGRLWAEVLERNEDVSKQRPRANQPQLRGPDLPSRQSRREGNEIFLGARQAQDRNGDRTGKIRRRKIVGCRAVAFDVRQGDRLGGEASRTIRVVRQSRQGRVEPSLRRDGDGVASEEWRCVAARHGVADQDSASQGKKLRLHWKIMFAYDQASKIKWSKKFALLEMLQIPY